MSPRELAGRWLYTHVYKAHGIGGSLATSADWSDDGAFVDAGLRLAILVVRSPRDSGGDNEDWITVRGCSWSHLCHRVRRLLPELTCGYDLNQYATEAPDDSGDADGDELTY
jgi:hypothetical protein